jgi:primosomal replication protein N
MYGNLSLLAPYFQLCQWCVSIHYRMTTQAAAWLAHLLVWPWYHCWLYSPAQYSSSSSHIRLQHFLNRVFGRSYQPLGVKWARCFVQHLKQMPENNYICELEISVIKTGMWNVLQLLPAVLNMLFLYKLIGFIVHQYYMFKFPVVSIKANI